MTTDPRDLGGSIAGPGGPHDNGAVVIDTSKALLPTHTEVCLVDESGGQPLAAVELHGRINRTGDEATVLLIAGPDALAAWVSQLVGLAARAQGSPLLTHREFAQQFRDDLNRRMEEMP